MEISLSHRGDYAVRAVLDLAAHYGTGLRKAREIAEDMRIPKNFLSLILADLVREGILDATAGRSGGYVLALPPHEISLLRIVEIADGEITLKQCLLRGIPCGSDGYCAAHDAWAAAQDALTARLASTNFATLAIANARLHGTPAAAGASPSTDGVTQPAPSPTTPSRRQSARTSTSRPAARS